MRIEEYIENLKRGVGIAKALRIAETRMKETNPKNWEGIPRSVVYFVKDKRQKDQLDVKHLTYLHNWWTAVYFNMKKKYGN